MFKIGEFARIARVSVRLLHHYEERGLLRPLYVDQSSGYRYYSLEQLPRLHRILALKDLGLSLNQIAYLLDESVSNEAIRGILLLKQAELREKVQAEQQRLARVESRLLQLEQPTEFPPCDVVVKSTEPLHVLSLKRAIKPPETPHRLFKEVTAALREARIRQHVHAVLCIYYQWYLIQQHPDLKPRRRLIEAAYAIDPAYCDPLPVVGGRRMTAYTIPAYALVASTIHCGADNTRHLAHRAMHHWIEAHGYRPFAPGREFYLRRGSADHPEDHITEIQYPIEKVNVVRRGDA